MTKKQITQKEIVAYLQKESFGQSVRWIGSGWSSDAFEAVDTIIRVPKVSSQPYIQESYLLEYLSGCFSVQIPHTVIVKDPFCYVWHKKIEGYSWSVETYCKLCRKKQKRFA